MLFVADSQSQISVASTMKVILIGELRFNDWSLPLVVDLTVFPCSNSLSVYVSLPGIHHCKHVSFSHPRSLLDGAALHTGLSPAVKISSQDIVAILFCSNHRSLTL